MLGQLLTGSVSATISKLLYATNNIIAGSYNECVYTTAEKVTSGYLYTEVNFNNLPPIKETYDLCYILSSATEIECPLQASKLKQLNCVCR